jgi:hypothetical protein
MSTYCDVAYNRTFEAHAQELTVFREEHFTGQKVDTTTNDVTLHQLLLI